MAKSTASGILTFLVFVGLAGWLVVAPACAQDARTGDLRRLPVPNVTIYTGEVIRADLLIERGFYTSTASRAAVHNSLAELVGKVSRRTLPSGEPVPLNAVRDPFAVKQGQATTITFEAAGLQITGRGVPLQNGSPGDLISVRNEDGGNSLKGVVQHDGTIRVDQQ